MVVIVLNARWLVVIVVVVFFSVIVLPVLPLVPLEQDGLLPPLLPTR